MSRSWRTRAACGLIGESRRRDDRLDAMTLARLVRIDPEFLCPVKHRSAEAQADLTVTRARAALVRTRTMLVNAAHGLTKSYGERLRGCNSRGMKPQVAQDLSPELKRALEPMMREIESVSEWICEYDQMLESMARNRGRSVFAITAWCRLHTTFSAPGESTATCADGARSWLSTEASAGRNAP